MPTLYLHIGTPKTGTTALQNFLPANEEVLERHGICYPDFGFRYTGLGVHRNGHFLVTANYKDEFGNRVPEKEEADYQEGLRKLEEIGKKFPKVILSDEGIWKQSITDRENFWERLNKDLKRIGFDIKIIVYFRSQNLFVQSHWAQKIKEGAEYDFQEYLESPVFQEYPLDYYKYMRMLADIFGKEALIIRVFEKKQFLGENHTIQEDFLNIFGLKMSDGFAVEQAVYNTSFEGDYLKMKEILNSLPEFKSNKNLLISNIKNIQDQKLFEYNYKKYTFFRPGKEEEFMQHFNPSNSKVAREFLGREDGKLFYDEIKDYPEYKADTYHLLCDTILVYGRMMNILNDKCESNKAQISELNKKINALNTQIKEEKSERKKKDAELKAMIRELEQTSLLFRLRRKWRHITGKDKEEVQNQDSSQN